MKKNNYFYFRKHIFSFNNIHKVLDNNQNKVLNEIWNHSSFKETIFLASPNLYYEFEKLFENKITCIKTINNLKRTFIKYVIRSSSRSTPFGLIAGVGVSNFKNDFKTIQKKYRISHLNYLILENLIEKLEENKNIQDQLLFYVNSSYYRINKQSRYINKKMSNGKIDYHLEGFHNSEIIDFILNTSKNGASKKTLISKLISKGYEYEESDLFIKQLINEKLLTSDLELSVSSENPLDLLIKKLSKLTGVDEIINQLNDLKYKILELDENQFQKDKIPIYNSIINTIKTFNIEVNENKIIDTNLYLKDLTNKEVIEVKKASDTLLKTLPFLIKISYNSFNNNMESFKKEFKYRYEKRKIPLVKVLDMETGIGYGNFKMQNQNSFFHELMIPKKEKNNQRFLLNTNIDQIIEQKRDIALLKNHKEIILKDIDFKHLKSEKKYISNSIHALFEIIKTSDLNNNQNLIHLKKLGGVNAIKYMARFSNDNPIIKKSLKEVLKFQKRENIIDAEIVHLADSSIGNVLNRPIFRDYEIPYLGKSNINLNNQININDLLIYIEDDIVKLKSKSLQKEVVPYLSNMHNYYKNSLPIYEFLCDLNHQNKVTDLIYDWKNSNAVYYPRIRYQNIILQPQKWLFSNKILNHLNNNMKEEILLKKVNLWTKEYQIPKFIQLVHHDNKLFLNLENVDCIFILLKEIQKKDSFEIHEFLYKDSQDYTTEYITTFYS